MWRVEVYSKVIEKAYTHTGNAVDTLVTIIITISSASYPLPKLNTRKSALLNLFAN